LRGLTRDSNGEIVLGDIVTSVDGQAIGDLDDLYRVLDKKQFGDTVQAQIFRNGRTLTVPVKLNPLPQQSQSRPTRRY
jgi:S1-C subfamily serine protease